MIRQLLHPLAKQILEESLPRVNQWPYPERVLDRSQPSQNHRKSVVRGNRSPNVLLRILLQDCFFQIQRRRQVAREQTAYHLDEVIRLIRCRCERPEKMVGAAHDSCGPGSSPIPRKLAIGGMRAKGRPHERKGLPALRNRSPVHDTLVRGNINAGNYRACFPQFDRRPRSPFSASCRQKVSTALSLFLKEGDLAR